MHIRCAAATGPTIIDDQDHDRIAGRSGGREKGKEWKADETAGDAMVLVTSFLCSRRNPIEQSFVTDRRMAFGKREPRYFGGATSGPTAVA